MAFSASWGGGLLDIRGCWGLSSDLFQDVEPVLQRQGKLFSLGQELWGERGFPLPGVGVDPGGIGWHLGGTVYLHGGGLGEAACQ